MNQSLYSDAIESARCKRLESGKDALCNGKCISGETVEEHVNISSSTSIVWSGNSKVATVNQSGKVTAKKAGKATITATCGYASVSCKVRVARNQWDYLLERYKSNSKVKQFVFVKYEGNSRARVILYEKKAGNWKKTLSCMGNVGKTVLGKNGKETKKHLLVFSI